MSTWTQRSVHAPGLPVEEDDGEVSSHSHDHGGSSFRDLGNSPLERRETNPWVSEAHGGRSVTVASTSRHRSASEASQSRHYTAPGTSRSSSRPPRRSRTIRPQWKLPTRQQTRHRHERSSSSDLPPSQSFDIESSEEDLTEPADLTVQQAAALEQKLLADQIDRLQRKLALLQQGGPKTCDVGHTSVPPKKWTVVYEVKCLRSGRTTYHIDEPELIHDQELGHLHWQGQRQLTNIESWIRRQRTSFVIFRCYHCVHKRNESLDPDERLVVISDELDEALSAWFRTGAGLSIYDQDQTYRNRELYAPYVCFFHFEHEATQSLSDTDVPIWGARSFLEYLQTTMVTVAQEVESMFATGRVSAELMPYLFKPGSLVCFDQSGDLIACEQASVLKMTGEDILRNRNSYECLTTRIVFDGRFRRLDSPKFTFDVNFVGGRAVNIEDLPVQPVACISEERRLALERRGETFMKCEKQLYVTYPSEGGNHDFVRIFMNAI